MKGETVQTCKSTNVLASDHSETHDCQALLVRVRSYLSLLPLVGLREMIGSRRLPTRPILQSGIEGPT